MHETLHEHDVAFSWSETDEEVEGVKCYIGEILKKSETEEKSDMEDTSADSEWESVKVTETDAYKSESQDLRYILQLKVTLNHIQKKR